MKLKSVKNLLPLLALVFLFSSCLELKEEVYFKNNESGTFKFTINLSAIKDMVDMISQFSGESKEEMTDDVNDGFKDAETELKSIAGISNIKSINDQENLVFGISYDFKNMAALNKAMHKTFQNDELKNPIFFTYSKNKIERLDPLNIQKRIDEEVSEEDIQIPGLDPTAFFSRMKYTAEYSFEKKVSKASNDLSKLSLDQKKVTLDYYFMREDNKGKNIINAIEF